MHAFGDIAGHMLIHRPFICYTISVSAGDYSRTVEQKQVFVSFISSGICQTEQNVAHRRCFYVGSRYYATIQNDTAYLDLLQEFSIPIVIDYFLLFEYFLGVWFQRLFCTILAENSDTWTYLLFYRQLQKQRILLLPELRCFKDIALGRHPIF